MYKYVYETVIYTKVCVPMCKQGDMKNRKK